MSDVKISYLQITARSDYPTMGRLDLHLWEPTLQTLAKQEFKDFEFIVIDVFYHDRPNYFKEHNYGLKIKHLPAKPNPWNEFGLCQTCHQFNKGIIHADGELLFTDADSSMLPPALMGNLWQHYKDGYFVSLGFGADLTYVEGDEKYRNMLVRKQLKPDGKYEWVWGGQPIPERAPVPTDWYSFLGYKGEKVTIDFRYTQLFEGNDKKLAVIPPNWYYGISTISLEAALKLNGYDQNLDGDSVLSDVDLGYRLNMAGYNNLVMCRDSFVIEAYAGIGWHPSMKSRIEIKCNYGLMINNRLSQRYRANTPLSNADIDFIMNNICKKACDIQETCRTHYKHRAPFYDKNALQYYEHWKKHVMTQNIDLELEREDRLNGERQQEGTYVNY